MEDRVVAGVEPPQSGQVTDLRSGEFGIGAEGELRTSSSAAGLGRTSDLGAAAEELRVLAGAALPVAVGAVVLDQLDRP
jgi:hypothetical protein